MAGVAEHSIMRQTGHKKTETLRKHIRMGTLFSENAAAKSDCDIVIQRRYNAVRHAC